MRSLGIAFLWLVLLANALRAQSWQVDIDANLTLSQSAYSDNWVGGEAGALAWAGNVNSVAQKKLFPILDNKNTLKLAYGQTHTQDKETKHWQHPEKSTDLIDLESTFRFDLSGFVDPIVAMRALSQFVDYRDPADKKFLNPLVLTETAGIARVFIKKEGRELSVRFGGGLRQDVDSRREKEVEHNAGLEFVTDFKTPLSDRKIDYTTKLTLFQAVYYSEADALEGMPGADDWKAPDVNWENMLTASITKYLMVNLYTQLLYDKQISRAGRFKQTLSLGLTFKLI